MSTTTSASAHSLILARRVNGTPVFGVSGERVGHVEDLSINKVSGQVSYAILSFGGFLGIGEKYHPVPWSVLKYNTDKGGYIVPLDKSQLEAAPCYDLAELGGAGNDTDLLFRETVFNYYGPFGVTPYWL